MEKRSMTISRMIGIYIAVVSTLIGFTTLIAIVFIAVFLNGESSFAADNVEKAVEAWIHDCQESGEINTALFPEGADIIIVSADGEELFVKVSHSKEKALRKFARESSVENGRNLHGKDVYLLPEDYGNFKMGSMITGWYQMDKVWWYFAPDGSKFTGWLNNKGTWYYIEDGKMFFGGFKKLGED